MIVIEIPTNIWYEKNLRIGDIINFTHKVANLKNQPVKVISRNWHPDKPSLYTIELQIVDVIFKN